ncbi:MAG TPA: hypothetical protein VFS39_04685 [Nitrospira sp.]|nr:hypothetical protein [Nitrospira sp.]
MAIIPSAPTQLACPLIGSRKSPFSSARASKITLATVALGLALSSCATTPLPLHTSVGTLNIRKAPLTAALIMPDNMKNAVSMQEVSCAGTFAIPIGSELNTGLTQAFSQVFEFVHVVEDKSEATDNDVLVEMVVPELHAEGHCGSRRTLYATGPLYFLLIIFITPSDTYEAHAALTATVSSSEGQQLLGETFRSKVHRKDTITDYSADRRFAVENVFRESLTDSIQQLSRALAKSPQLREHADRRKSKSGERP